MYIITTYGLLIMAKIREIGGERMYSIGQTAGLLRVSVQSLRNWERQSKIPQPQRRPTGMREYTEADIEKIRNFLQSRK